MAKLVPLKDQLKEPTMSKPITGPKLSGSSTARQSKAKTTINKMDCSREVYNRMLGEKRKDVVMAFVSECGLTIAGAGTYFQLHKKSAES